MSESRLWQYSCSLYARPGVKETCLALQDRHGLNVNVVLLLCWCEQQHQAPSRQQLAQLLDAVALWQRDYIQPQRQLRRKLTQASEGTSEAKNKLLAAELALEKIGQSRLLAAFNDLAVAEAESAESADNGDLAYYVGSKDPAAVSALRACF